MIRSTRRRERVSVVYRRREKKEIILRGSDAPVVQVVTRDVDPLLTAVIVFTVYSEHGSHEASIDVVTRQGRYELLR